MFNPETSSLYYKINLWTVSRNLVPHQILPIYILYCILQLATLILRRFSFGRLDHSKLKKFMKTSFEIRMKHCSINEGFVNSNSGLTNVHYVVHGIITINLLIIWNWVIFWNSKSIKVNHQIRSHHQHWANRTTKNKKIFDHFCQSVN